MLNGGWLQNKIKNSDKYFARVDDDALSNYAATGEVGVRPGFRLGHIW